MYFLVFLRNNCLFQGGKRKVQEAQFSDLGESNSDSENFIPSQKVRKVL